MSSTIRRALAALLALVVVAGMAACGDDDDSAGEGAGSSSTPAGEEGSDDESDDSGSDDGAGEDEGDDQGDDEEEDGGSSGGSDPNSAFCKDARSFSERFDDFDAEIGTDLSKAGDVFTQASDAMDSFDAPSEIADDWSLLSKALDRLGEAYGDIDFSDAESLDKLESVASDIEAELGDIDSASERIDAYFSDVCGIDS